MAELGCVKERVLKRQTPANHLNIAKFDSSFDHDYRRIYRFIRNSVSKAVPNIAASQITADPDQSIMFPEEDSEASKARSMYQLTLS
jgi:hypothetical protein